MGFFGMMEGEECCRLEDMRLNGTPCIVMDCGDGIDKIGSGLFTRSWQLPTSFHPRRH